jgi:4-hydroxy-2-oxoheptanedioate aldolase
MSSSQPKQSSGVRDSMTFLSRIADNDGLPLLGSGLTIASPLLASLAAETFDWVMIDMEHSPLSAGMATQMVHAVAATTRSSSSRCSCLPLVRIPSHGVEWIKWALDSGAAGIVIPMVNDAAEMEDIIGRALYPPRGHRSFGPLNALIASNTHSHESYYAKAQRRDIAILPMIESSKGVDNAEAIMSVDGVSGVFIGPTDLQLSLGLRIGGLDRSEAVFLQAIEKICRLGEALGKPIGSMGVGEVARKRAAEGMKFLLATVDYSALVNGFQSAKEAALHGLPSAKPRL